MIRRRHVFYIHGFDPQGATGYHRLFRRELSRFLKLWPVDASLSEPEIDDDGVAARWQIKTRGPNWRVETTYEFLRWDDIVARDMRRSIAVLIPRIALWLIEYLINGTSARIMRVSWRFSLHYLFPTLAMALVVPATFLVGWLAFLLAHAAIGAGVPLSAAASIAAAGAYWAFSLWFFERWYVYQICEAMLWFRDFVHDLRSNSQKRIDDFARRIIAKARASDADELLVIGHSVGGAVAVATVARALELDPDFARASAPVTLATLGSLLPVAALHPLGVGAREAIRRLAIEPSLTWLDCQARKDVMNFYGCDMVEDMAVDAGPQHRNPLYWRVRFRDVVSPQFYNYLRWNFFRMHYQFIMASDRHAPYDYYMIICGPIRLLDWARDNAKASASLAQDASYTPDVADAAASAAAPLNN